MERKWCSLIVQTPLIFFKTTPNLDFRALLLEIQDFSYLEMDLKSLTYLTKCYLTEYRSKIANCKDGMQQGAASNDHQWLITWHTLSCSSVLSCYICSNWLTGNCVFTRYDPERVGIYVVPCLGYRKQCCNEHWGACIFPGHVFFWLYAQDCDRRVMW